VSAGKYRRFSPQSGHLATIHESGKVWTGAGNILYAAIASLKNESTKMPIR
jgi:hypothetical protein